MLIRDVGQFVDGGQLWWGAEGSCRTCPTAWCEQDTGAATPEAIRQALPAEHGPARPRLAGPGSSSVPVLRALRETHGLSLARARAMADGSRTTGPTGTPVGMELVAAALGRRSVAATVESAAD
ncbi:hypothetical protein [Kitasatospora purpeofusca]|uniref:hypothetical protein n=1 Tax=Kitasatospora purpeofusca TaxID=67352 RepID=UPI0037FD47C9